MPARRELTMRALCGQRHVAHPHVLDHALAERGHLLR
jgi:hypothetical protein